VDSVLAKHGGSAQAGGWRKGQGVREDIVLGHVTGGAAKTLSHIRIGVIRCRT
jgi:hypothetical protein